MDEQPLPQPTDQPQSPPLEQPMSVDEPKPKSKLPFLAALAVLVVGGIVGIFFIKRISPSQPATPQSVISPTPTSVPSPVEASMKEGDPMADWKTYSNNFFTFKYPGNWVANPVDYLNSVHLTTIDKKVAITISKGQYPYGYVKDSVFEVKNIKILVETQEYFAKEVSAGNDIFVDFKLNGDQGYHVLFGTGYPGGLGGNGSKAEYENSKEDILKILSTFKFLEQTPAADTSSWKTYTNSVYKYSLSYPSVYYMEAPIGEKSKFITLTNYDNKNLTVEQVKKPIWSGKTKLDIQVAPANEPQEFQTEYFNSNPELRQKIMQLQTVIEGSPIPLQYYVNSNTIDFFATISHEKNVYIFSGAVMNSNDLTKIGQILSTFRFLK